MTTPVFQVATKSCSHAPETYIQLTSRHVPSEHIVGSL